MRVRNAHLRLICVVTVGMGEKGGELKRDTVTIRQEDAERRGSSKNLLGSSRVGLYTFLPCSCSSGPGNTASLPFSGEDGECELWYNSFEVPW